MKNLSSKIDFVLVFSVRNANPNGDPLSGNRPRTDYNGFGEVSDVCLKRKIRDRLQENGCSIFVQPNDRKNDTAKSLRDRAETFLGDKFGSDEMAPAACKQWLDVRMFGQLFAFSKKGKGGKKGKKGEVVESTESVDENKDGVAIPIRGPVSIHSAFSVDAVNITSTQITKSVNGETVENKAGEIGYKRSSDTMGMKHRVDYGVYVMRGSMNPQLAERTGFSDADADLFKGVLPKLFENYASSARPD